MSKICIVHEPSVSNSCLGLCLKLYSLLTYACIDIVHVLGMLHIVQLLNNLHVHVHVHVCIYNIRVLRFLFIDSILCSVYLSVACPCGSSRDDSP